MAHHKVYQSVQAYVTKDGSIIRELMHPNQDPVKNQSIAEAIIHVGMATYEHRHHTSEEVYYVTQGEGQMRLGDQVFTIQAGDTIGIPPGTVHSVQNTGKLDLKIICASSPPYSHEDTELIP